MVLAMLLSCHVEPATRRSRTGLTALSLSGEEVSLDPARRHYAVSAASLGAETRVVVETMSARASVTVRWETGAGTILDADVRGAIALAADQRLEIDVREDGATTRWSISVPPDHLPPVEAVGEAPAEYFFLTPHETGAAEATGYGLFLMIVDGHGVPVWWRESPARSYDFRVSGDGRFSANTRSGEERACVQIDPFTGQDIRSWLPERPDGWDTVENDPHELVVDPDGGSLYTLHGKGRLDFTEIGGAPDGLAQHAALQERDASGQVTTTWSPEPFIDLSLLPPDAIENQTLPGPFRYAHINSVDRMDGGWLVSLRTAGEVLRVDRDSGEVVWRLGGPRSDFVFVDDPRGGFFGQHSARWLPPDGVMLFDNRTNYHSPAIGDVRFVEYRLDEVAGTATLVDSFVLEGAGGTDFAGSVQRLDDGRTVVSWGSTQRLDDGSRAPTVTVIAPNGEVSAELRLPEGSYSYRVWTFAGDPLAGVW